MRISSVLNINTATQKVHFGAEDKRNEYPRYEITREEYQKRLKLLDQKYEQRKNMLKEANLSAYEYKKRLSELIESYKLEKMELFNSME